MTPEQEEQVRRTLASVPAEPGVPSDVAARLDATLARLVAERGAAGEPDVAPSAPRVDELEQRRRRRWPRVLVAAASVAVLAYGAGVVLDGLAVSGGDAASTAARDETFAGAGAGGAESGGQAAPEAPGVMPPSAGAGEPDAGVLDAPQAGKARSVRALTARTVRLHRDTLARDVGDLLAGKTLVDGRAPRTGRVREDRAAADLLAPCAPPAVGPGDRYAPARLDGARATLVVRRGTDGTRVAEVHSCGDPGSLLAVARLSEAE
ncbi:MAG: hypothetical protein ACTHKG_12275 [Nocardioides sp.]